MLISGALREMSVQLNTLSNTALLGKHDTLLNSKELYFLLELRQPYTSSESFLLKWMTLG